MCGNFPFVISFCDRVVCAKKSSNFVIAFFVAGVVYLLWKSKKEGEMKNKISSLTILELTFIAALVAVIFFVGTGIAAVGTPRTWTSEADFINNTGETANTTRTNVTVTAGGDVTLSGVMLWMKAGGGAGAELLSGPEKAQMSFAQMLFDSTGKPHVAWVGYASVAPYTIC